MDDSNSLALGASYRYAFGSAMVSSPRRRKKVNGKGLSAIASLAWITTAFLGKYIQCKCRANAGESEDQDLVGNAPIAYRGNFWVKQS